MVVSHVRFLFSRFEKSQSREQKIVGGSSQNAGPGSVCPFFFFFNFFFVSNFFCHSPVMLFSNDQDLFFIYGGNHW